MNISTKHKLGLSVVLLVNLFSVYWYGYYYTQDLLFGLGLAAIFIWMIMISMFQTNVDNHGIEKHTVGMSLVLHERLIKFIRVAGILIILTYSFIFNQHVSISDLLASANVGPIKTILGVFYLLITGISIYFILIFSYFDLRQIFLGENPYTNEFDIRHKKIITFLLGLPVIFLALLLGVFGS